MDYKENMKSLENIDIGDSEQIEKWRKWLQQTFCNFAEAAGSFISSSARNCLKLPLTRASSCLSSSDIHSLMQLREWSHSWNCCTKIGTSTRIQQTLQKANFKSCWNSSILYKPGKRFDFNDRLDQFYFEIIGSQQKFAALWDVIKIVLVLSHGNARVEAEFSINKDILCPNLKEMTLQA